MSSFETAQGFEALVSLLENACICRLNACVCVCVCVSQEENRVKGRRMGDMTNGRGQIFSPSTLRRVLPQLREGPDIPLLSLHVSLTLFLFVSLCYLSVSLSLTHTHTLTQKTVIIRNV